RTYNKDLDIIPAQKVEDEKVILTWHVQNVKALAKEPFSEDLDKLSPSVLLAPTDFLIDGYQGNAETWENFGKWIYSLNEGKRNLSPETQQKIYSLIRDKNSNIEKAQILYEYLQDKTRYVSVQVGIGGWQPIEADQVDRLSFGDCKALTNYMKALLDIAGIPSYYTLVRAGRNSSDIISDFPSNQFNHAILCTLIDNDTVWLECTSQRMPFGYIGSFTDDREVVLINEKGGNLVRTKVYTYDENQKNCKANIEIDMEGNLSCSVNTGYKGMFYDENLKIMLSDDYDMEKLIREKLHLPNFSLQNFNLEENHDFHPSIDLNVQLSVNSYGKKFGNKMAINLNLLNKLETIPPSKDLRHSDIILKRSFIENDTLIYTIPEGYQVEKTSSNRSVQTEFGEFKSTIIVDGLNIQYVRYLKINKGIYPPDRYNQFSEFYSAVKQGDEDRVILMSK
ncbi:DUF3858 domain-containing protein, partial [Dolichospermum sp. ST_sed3]|nr:DUF3858 domain-containing protein [Dolichospermum sp. ST_sed3]